MRWILLLGMFLIYAVAYFIQVPLLGALGWILVFIGGWITGMGFWRFLLWSILMQAWIGVAIISLIGAYNIAVRYL